MDTTMTKEVKILALFGESGTGKNAIQNWICSVIPHTKKIVPCTTRPQRSNEINHIDYHFLTNTDFFTKMSQNLFLEISTFNGWYYGTSIDELLLSNLINIGVFNPSSLKILCKNPHFIIEDKYNINLNILPIHIITDAKTRLLRALNREENPDCVEICRRFLADEEDFKNLDFSSQCYYNMTDVPFNAILQDATIKNFLEVKND